MVCAECGGEILATDASFVNATKENVHIRRSECWRRRIADLVRQLAEAREEYRLNDVRWLESSGHMVKELATTKAQLAEARKAAEWTPITPENLPKRGQLIFWGSWGDSFPDAIAARCDWDHVIHNGWFISPPSPEGSKS
jgi:hypothetical protein